MVLRGEQTLFVERRYVRIMFRQTENRTKLSFVYLSYSLIACENVERYSPMRFVNEEDLFVFFFTKAGNPILSSTATKDERTCQTTGSFGEKLFRIQTRRYHRLLPATGPFDNNPV